ncbi:hypothetical protein [Catellatospora sp. NPDC049609]|uniref:hypothetical protein n=1 Tax=Catellatospora sp. NPDC049609 TaxID=3155505 RepID=UPI00343EFF73
MSAEGYRPIATALGEGLGIAPANIGASNVYDEATGMILVHGGLTEPEIRVAVAEALAERDLRRYGRNPQYGTDVQMIALARLLPDGAFNEAYAQLSGGVGALAHFFDVPPTAVRAKLNYLAQQPRPRAGLRLVGRNA